MEQPLDQNDGPAPLTINGDIRGQARQFANGAYDGGRLLLRSDTGGEIVLNGDAALQRQVELRDGVRVTLGGVLYNDDGLTDEAALLVNDSTLRLGSLNADDEGAGLGSLGYLPKSSDRIVLNNGTLEITNRTITTRGFTIGAGGATLLAELGPRVVFSDSAANPEQDVVSDAGGDLTLTGEGVATFAKRLGGSGGLRKQGGGVWTLFAANTYTGPTTVEQGTLLVEGLLAGGPTTVAAGGVIEGAGSVGGNVTVEGEVAPTGDFIIGGDADFLAGSTLAIDLEAEGHDRLVVSGAATVAAEASLAVSVTEAPGVGDRFEVLAATGGLTGTFSTLLTPGLDPTLQLVEEYSAGALSLIASPALPGDFNTDGVVDAADYGVWRETYLSTDDLRADADLDGVVDDQDYLLWAANLGDSLDASATTTPEPSTMLGITIMVVGLCVLDPKTVCLTRTLEAYGAADSDRARRRTHPTLAPVPHHLRVKDAVFR